MVMSEVASSSFDSSHVKPLPITPAVVNQPGSKVKKRSVPHDFFLPSSQRLKPSLPISPFPQSSPPASLTSVPGLTLHSDFITPTEEADLIAYLDSSALKPHWRTDLARRTLHFGGTYCLYTPRSSPSHTRPAPSPEPITAPPLPSALAWLLHRLTTSTPPIFPPERPPTHIIVNEYRDRQGISAHAENFSFAEPVVGLSLLARCPMRFRELARPDGGSVRSGKAQRAERTGEVVDVWLERRSLVVMRGESRWRWQHEITRSAKGRGEGWRRVSLTFRLKLGPEDVAAKAAS